MRAERCEQGTEGVFRAARDVLRQVIARRVLRGLDLASDLGVRIRLASSVGALNALAERLAPSCLLGREPVSNDRVSGLRRSACRLLICSKCT